MEYTVAKFKIMILRNMIHELQERNRDLANAMVPTIDLKEITENQNLANEIEAGRQILKELEAIDEKL